MNAIVPLWAALDAELIKALVFLAIILLGGLAQLLAKMKQARPPGGAVPPQAPKGNLGEAIDNFLRRVADEFAEKNRDVRPPPPEPELTQRPGTAKAGGAQPSPTHRTRRRTAQRPIAAGEQPVAAEVVSGRPVGGQVSEHVKKYLDEQEFAHRSAQLGAEVAHADSEIDQHLHKKFDHAIGKLAAVPGQAAVPPMAVEPAGLPEVIANVSAASVSGLALALANPDWIRQAIMLNEILHRPEERWG